MGKVRLTAAALPTASSLVLGPPLDQLVEIARRKLMTFEELKAIYSEKKTRATSERDKLEVMRGAFGMQSNLVHDLEADVSNLKDEIADTLMRREGLEL